MSVSKYIYYSTLLSVFTEAFVTRFVIDIKLFYFIIIINFVLMILSGKFAVSKSLLIIYSCLLVTGIITILLQTDNVSHFLAQYLGILFVSVYFYNFYRFYVKDVKVLFIHFVYFALAVAYMGFILMPYRFLLGRFEGFYSFMNEPAHYATVILPAYFYSLKTKELPRYIYKVLLASLVLTGSSVGLLGIGISILMLPKKIEVMRLVLPLIIVCGLITGLYFVYPNFRLRIDDTVRSLATQDVGGANLSTYAFVSNAFVTYSSFYHNPILGSGLGSHELSHIKYLGDITGFEDFKEDQNLNAKDANSLLLRTISDMGLFGVFCIFWFIIRNYPTHSPDVNMIYLSRAILLYFFCKLLREGHYFSPEMYFYVFAYFFSYKTSKVLKHFTNESAQIRISG
ncbi:hypothetical protein [Mucilaginibacter ginkgonis]|uniref:O-antigen ligase-like membrane protein n=1 Tax=Mucilaginibacter ginkgonis TaxID=2682091 RepID=A0A6I4I295_9SPHI|nr:hypothetical protein [Mucilaginibacter ginkgonis]QQL50855.1 hypothetical protein GO620_005190 [Mucilaginibacter ginkgonis]